MKTQIIKEEDGSSPSFIYSWSISHTCNLLFLPFGKPGQEEKHFYNFAFEGFFHIFIDKTNPKVELLYCLAVSIFAEKLYDTKVRKYLFWFKVYFFWFKIG